MIMSTCLNSGPFKPLNKGFSVSILLKTLRVPLRKKWHTWYNEGEGSNFMDVDVSKTVTHESTYKIDVKIKTITTYYKS